MDEMPRIYIVSFNVNNNINEKDHICITHLQVRGKTAQETSTRFDINLNFRQWIGFQTLTTYPAFTRCMKHISWRLDECRYELKESLVCTRPCSNLSQIMEGCGGTWDVPDSQPKETFTTRNMVTSKESNNSRTIHQPWRGGNSFSFELSFGERPLVLTVLHL